MFATMLVTGLLQGSVALTRTVIEFVVQVKEMRKNADVEHRVLQNLDLVLTPGEFEEIEKSQTFLKALHRAHQWKKTGQL